MTTEEKYKAITEKLKNKNIDFDPTHISSMVVIGYLNDLAKLGLIETEYKITEMGENVRAICEEFDWKPSDLEIREIVLDIVDLKQQAPFLYMLTRYCNDREKFLAEVERFREYGEV